MVQSKGEENGPSSYLLKGWKRSTGNGWWSISVNILTVHFYSLTVLCLILYVNNHKSSLTVHLILCLFFGINIKINMLFFFFRKSDITDGLIYKWWKWLVLWSISVYILTVQFYRLPLFWNLHQNQHVFFVDKSNITDSPN